MRYFGVPLLGFGWLLLSLGDRLCRYGPGCKKRQGRLAELNCPGWIARVAHCGCARRRLSCRKWNRRWPDGAPIGSTCARLWRDGLNGACSRA